ncbi:MAG: hypothetical protein COZ06_07280 [Armatimonadetes bacterium CG_4_10_14_3_um_filter_66_18]|nr:M48 family metalloprotease [Armatimonadota bacterium]OIO95189.1 MAG: hypothetical protein AUJ96_27310 [Armatimonadetes bacterium CG2_30_66_41]PIU91975.1 MAG: hypothetical protein COS65_20115 [Armatimonadetes bacterium CG06_land_8_20_14_3_00_66_21]PIX36840.1 MAG: hypothetical protein COZ57_37430 [Armatimonadetes bacterium CG_4_8_14_3_um_filter_66_20]PIY50831.1 MAG: hypothetical protein COZ06_07280 [Armatimonadetes bacterium CG_4_10_14_3_um_filter_66_18]
MASLLYNLGRMVGPSMRKGKWLWQSLTGTEQERMEAEWSVGRDLAAAMRSGMAVDPAPEAAQLLTEVGAELAKCTRSQFRRFEFTVVGQDTPNAFALPGGFVFVTRPLLDLMGADRDELAFLLGHELSHVTEEHALQRVVADLTIGAAMRRLSSLGAVAQSWMKTTGGRLLQSAYSRDTELAADRLGAQLAGAAGFDRGAATRMLTRLQASAGRSEGKGIAAYFASHPPFDVRIAELERHLAR